MYANPVILGGGRVGGYSSFSSTTIIRLLLLLTLPSVSLGVSRWLLLLLVVVGIGGEGIVGGLRETVWVCCGGSRRKKKG